MAEGLAIARSVAQAKCWHHGPQNCVLKDPGTFDISLGTTEESYCHILFYTMRRGTYFNPLKFRAQSYLFLPDDAVMLKKRKRK